MKLAALVVLAISAASAQGQAQVADTERANRFDDPFFRISTGLASCPAPLGPLLTADEQRKEAHARVERGTSCWLAGKCKDSNAYRYDKLLASPVEAALKSLPGVAASSVWVTIQRRWVFLEGCVMSREQAAQLELAARQVPDVESVVTNLALPGEAPRYRLLAPR